MLLYVILIALVNVVLGYALGVYLGYAPAAWRGAASTIPPAETDAAAEATSEVEQSPLLQNPAPKGATHPRGVLERLVDKFVAGVAELRGELLKLDGKAAGGAPIQDCMDVFRALKDEHLQNLKSSLDEFDRQKTGFSNLAGIGGKIQYTVRLQINAIQPGAAIAEGVEADASTGAAHGKLCRVVRDLTAATDHCQDELEVARLEIARKEGWLTESEAAWSADPKSGMRRRPAAEAAITRLWEQPGGGRGQLCVALIEADLYRQILSEHGPELCDRVLAAIGKLVNEIATADELVVRYAAQQYMIVFPDKLARQCANKVETVRQQVEQSRLVGDGREVRLTTSCAVIQADDDDTLETLIARLEETLEEAKRYGRNRTFIHEGKYPAPLVPLELDIPVGMVEF
ncbi:MAG: diguanylate cyclase [Pirellulales bacterium]